MSCLSREAILDCIQGIEGWLSNEVAELLIDCARRMPANAVIVEIGSWKGKSTACLALARPDVRVFAIDPFTGSQEHRHMYGDDVETYPEFCNNLKNLNVKTRVVEHVMTSKEAVSQVSENIGLLWIDGSHEYQDVLEDFQLWFPKVVEGGFVLFHDSKWPGVRKVLWESFYPCSQLSSIRRIEDTTFAQKTRLQSKGEREVNLASLEVEKNRQQLKRLDRKLGKIGKKIKAKDKSLDENHRSETL